MKTHRILSLLAATCAFSAAGLASETVTTFANGAEGWSGPQGIGGATTLDPTGGNPAENLHTVFNDFGVTFRNNTNTGFVFDYTTSPSVTISHDLKVEDISSIFSGPTIRPWLVELRDYDNPPSGFPWVSVWYKWDDISSAVYGSWTTLSVTIDDTSSTTLPAGWNGYGAEDSFGAPMLPADRTFSSVLAGVDEIAFHSLEPGFFFIAVDFDLRIDNPRVSLAREPGTASCFGVGCPCANDDATAGCANSTTSGALLGGGGTASVGADDLVLTATGLPANQQGLFYMGDAVVSNNLWDGKQCALGTSFRFLGSIQSSGAAGEMSYTGFAADAPGMIVSGSTWHFHCWYRDVPGTPCGTGANFSNLYSVTFTP